MKTTDSDFRWSIDQTRILKDEYFDIRTDDNGTATGITMTGRVNTPLWTWSRANAKACKRGRAMTELVPLALDHLRHWERVVAAEDGSTMTVSYVAQAEGSDADILDYLQRRPALIAERNRLYGAI